VQRPDPAETDGPGPFGDLIVDVGVFEHGLGLVFKLLSHQSGFEILLVTEVGFVVSFIHLECAPFGCIMVLQIPIIPNNGAYSRVFYHFSQIITLV
jgi:hypothetical protein